MTEDVTRADMKSVIKHPLLIGFLHDKTQSSPTSVGASDRHGPAFQENKLTAETRLTF